MSTWTSSSSTSTTTTRSTVGPDLSVPGRPEVFAVSDVAWITDTGEDEVLPQLGSVALQAGEQAGDNVARLAAGKPTEPFVYKDKGTMATIGRGAAVLQFRRGRTMKGKAASLAWGAVHLALLSTGEDRGKALIDWTWAGFTHERSPGSRYAPTSVTEDSAAVAPSVDQVELAFGSQRAVVVEVGGGIRTYSADGHEILDGYGVDERCPSGRGQLLLPWPNRIQDGSYEFDGRRHQLPLTEPELGNAIHGLSRWAAWRVGEREPSRVVMEHTVHAQPGYPFTLALRDRVRALGREPLGPDDARTATRTSPSTIPTLGAPSPSRSTSTTATSCSSPATRCPTSTDALSPSSR